MKQTADEMDRIDIGLDAAAEKALLAYEWPGNVRELANVLERTLSRMEGTMIHLEDLPFFISGRQNRSVFEKCRHPSGNFRRKRKRTPLWIA